VLDAVCRGEIAPGDGARLTRRARKPLRAIRRAMWRETALRRGRAPRRSVVGRADAEKPAITRRFC